MGTSPALQFPAMVAGPFFDSSFIYLFFFFFHHTLLQGDFSCPLRYLESSANVQQLLCENCSICRWILDVPVRGHKFCVLLFHHLDSSPRLKFSELFESVGCVFSPNLGIFWYYFFKYYWSLSPLFVIDLVSFRLQITTQLL